LINFHSLKKIKMNNKFKINKFKLIIDESQTLYQTILNSFNIKIKKENFNMFKTLLNLS
jgi:hypothetical protein